MKMQWFTRMVILGLSLCWLMASPSSQSVKAAGIVVNTAEDVISTNSKCSLREAIINANNDSNTHTDCTEGSGSDTITFANDYIITLNVSQLPSITSTIIITGNGREKSIIQAHSLSDTANWRIFNVDPSGNLTLSGLTLKHGKVVESGGGIFNNAGALTIDECSISDNVGNGGGIFNDGGTVTITNSFISNNSAGTSTNAGGIYNSYGTLIISGCTFYENTGYNGGGIFNLGSGSVTVTNSTFSSNSAEYKGGGIINFNDGILTISHSTFSGNTAINSGGGIYNNTNGILDYRNTIIANSTGGDCVNLGTINTTTTGNLVEDGTCSPDLTGDPLLEPLSDNGGPTLTHALNGESHVIDQGTFSACTTFDQRGVSRPQGIGCDIGAYEVDFTSPEVTEFIVPSPSFILNIPITSFEGSDNNSLIGGYMVTSSPTAPAANDPGWLITAPPYFSVATDDTYSLYPWVKDTDGNVSAVFGSPRSVVVDTSSMPSDVIIVNTDSDDMIAGDDFCTLREAITNANNDSDTSGGDCAAGSGDDTITFAGYYVIEPSSSYPKISSTISIVGYGPLNTILQSDPFGSYSLGVFTIDMTNKLTLENLTIQNFPLTAIYNILGNVTINNCKIYANTSIYNNVGGILNYSGTFTITDSSILENTSENGGGVYNGSSGSMTITNSSISNNFANANGGGIYNLGNLSITNSHISENSTINNINGFGGGIYTDNGSLTISNSTIFGNTAVKGAGIYRNETITMIINSNITGNSNGLNGSIGGGIYSYSSTPLGFSISGCLIDNNFSTSFGGGIYLSENSRMTLTNSTITGNISNMNGGGIFNQGLLFLINVTINDHIGGGISNYGILEFSNTIISNTSYGGDCNNFGTIGNNISNIVEDGSCDAAFSGDPNLGPLADNGGPTLTHALLEGSPAIDTGDSASCPLTDQRGVIRPQRSGCDIGAFELENLGIFLPLILR